MIGNNTLLYKFVSCGEPNSSVAAWRMTHNHNEFLYSKIIEILISLPCLDPLLQASRPHAANESLYKTLWYSSKIMKTLRRSCYCLDLRCQDHGLIPPSLRLKWKLAMLAQISREWKTLLRKNTLTDLNRRKIKAESDFNSLDNINQRILRHLTNLSWSNNKISMPSSQIKKLEQLQKKQANP